MGKNHLSYIYLLFGFILLILSLFIVSGASISKIGNLSDSIQEKYAPNEIIKGKINLSLSNDNSNYMLSGFSTNIELIDFLRNTGFISGVHFTCDISGCESGYAKVGAGATSISFNLAAGASKTIGLNVKSSLNLNNFVLDFSSSNSESCANPLVIDFFDNNETRWTSNIISPSFFSCGNENYGCYNPSKLAGSVSIQLNSSYCERVSIDSAAAVKVGADISGSGNAVFLFYLEEEEGIDSILSCSATASSSGKISCIINKAVAEPTNISVCLMKISGANYNINYEDYNNEDICGYSEVLGNFIERDSPIFGQAIKFGTITKAVINSSSYNSSHYSETGDYLEAKISEYLEGKDCSNWCVVPVTFISGSNSGQTIIINSLKASYVDMNFNSIYDLNKVNAKITMPYSLIDVSSIGIKAPTTAGFYDLVLKLNNNSLITKKIEVVNAPVVKSMSLAEIPSQIALAGNNSILNVPAGAEINFVAGASGSNITSYKWNFGDNSGEQITSTNTIKYKYATIGSYVLRLSIVNNLGIGNASFNINTISPKDYLNSSLVSYRNNIASLKAKISDLPSLVGDMANKKFDLNNKEIKLQELQLQYENAGNDSAKYIEILNQLYSLSVPIDIKISNEASGKFVVDKNKVGLANMKTLVGESIEHSETILREAVFAWALENLDININLKVYSSLIGNETMAFASDVSVDLKNKKDASKVYAVINELKENIQIDGLTLTSLAGAAGASFDIGNGKSFEFVIPREVEILDIPIYFSSPISELAFDLNVTGCNNNDVCEKNKGENSKNCSNDCRPWKLAWWYIFVALFFVFCLYILCQEWYKRKYENYLFKSSNDLYNLIQFINNAEKQKINMSAALVKLTEKGWTGEQVAYAYKKFKGKRTGMWEIPIFRFLENRKVKEEIARRDVQERSQANQLSHINPNMQKNIGIKPGMIFKPANSLNNPPRPPANFTRQPIKPVDVQKKIFGVPPKIEPAKVGLPAELKAEIKKDEKIEKQEAKNQEKIEKKEDKNEQKNILTQKPMQNTENATKK
jgi:hypothetical protein